MKVTKQLRLKKNLSNVDIISALSKLNISLDIELISDVNVGEPLKNYLYLTYLPHLLLLPLDELTRYYNRYYWLSIFVTEYKKKFGENNGLEQQLFKVIEEASTLDEPVDWNLIEKFQQESFFGN